MEITGYYKVPLIGMYIPFAEVVDVVIVIIDSSEVFKCDISFTYSGSAVYKLTNSTTMNTTMLNSYNEEVIITYNEVIPAPITTTSHIN
ncbi:hypothetical protein RI543_005190 [Arxiozyma heterogenica]|uniref:Uncharacterized protein n=1 Tax=Arxiozyma heterogenica TaxID=278026 RepID=A0AAN7WKZ2_9SACH|nr:hypothetical protein RI543_005190 [Kazachstania heterogenica]